MPVVRAKKEIRGLGNGDILEILATDPGSVKDIPAWANRVGHEFLETVDEDGLFRHYVKKSQKEEA
ncbi:sulfurtransferase TusA family protein [Alicyclobacillus sp. SO9]|nr:sulfurtransferase TusA family protein [Alicyclobacillus sp. SO9]